MSRARGPSIEDVAREAGVSVATVSRALRGLPNVAERTRERVEAVAAAMNYRADPSAARLATGRTNLVQLVTPTVDGWYFSRFIAGAIEHLLGEGYEAITHPIENPEQREAFLAQMLSLEKRVDGVIVVDLNISEDAASQLHQTDSRLVTAGFRTQKFPAVVVDDYQVGFLATKHLLDLGHRRIGLISGEPNHPLAFSVPGLRLAGYTGALAAAGIAIETELEQSGFFTADGGRRAMERLLDLPEPPTAVFAMSDEMAFGAWRALQDRGLRWPDDVAVVGIDDHELADLVELTTIRLAPRDMGAAAAARLLRLIDEDGVYVPADDEPVVALGDWEGIGLVARASTVGFH